MKLVIYVFCGLALTGCATVSKPPATVEAPYSKAVMLEAQKATLSVPETKLLKRKIAIGRFSNETRYGRTLIRDGDLDPLGKQASDMLASRLVSSQKFLVFERPDIEKIQREQAVAGVSNLIGVDTLLMGSVTEFGRSNTGKKGFLSSTKLQTAHAAVEIRLVDPHTGHVFFSARGQGEATMESGSVAGFGSRASYDATLNDKAIGAAISDVMNELVAKLEERPWRTDILEIQGNRVLISGGQHQGLKVGDTLSLVRAGDKVKSRQTGFEIELPGTKVATLRLLSHFGDSPETEGSVTEIIAGEAPTSGFEDYYLTEE